jgi:hypothetical protein
VGCGAAVVVGCNVVVVDPVAATAALEAVVVWVAAAVVVVGFALDPLLPHAATSSAPATTAPTTARRLPLCVSEAATTYPPLTAGLPPKRRRSYRKQS